MLTSVGLDNFKASLKQSLSGAEIICQDSLWLHSTVNKTEMCYCFSYLITSSPRAIEKSHYIYYLQTCCKNPYCNVARCSGNLALVSPYLSSTSRLFLRFLQHRGNFENHLLQDALSCRNHKCS